MSILSIGLVQRTGNQCHDRPCAMIGQVPVQLETISPMGIAWKAISSKYRYDNFVFIVNDKYYYHKPTNLFCSHWFKPKAHRSMKCPCRLRCATQKHKETEKDSWEIVDIAQPKINPVEGWGNLLSKVHKVRVIRQRATTNWESLIGKICKIFHQQRVVGLHLSHMRKYAWITKAMKKKGPKQK